MYANPQIPTPHADKSERSAIHVPARPPALALNPASVLALQRTAGNHAVARLLQREPAEPVPVTDVASLPAHEKLLRAAGYAVEEGWHALVDELKALLTPESVALMTGFVALYVGAQLTPAGWVADGIALAALTVSAIFVGAMLFEIINDLVGFIGAVNATSEEDLRAAGQALARAAATGGVAVVVALLTHAAVKGGGTGTGYNGPPAAGFAELVTAEGIIVRVPMAAVGELTATAPRPALMVPPPSGEGGDRREPQRELTEDEKWKQMEDAVRKQEEAAKAEEAASGAGADPTARKIAEGHAFEHDGEFPELAGLTPEEARATFVDLVDEAMSSPRTEVKTSGDRKAYWWPGDDARNPILVIEDPANVDGGTAFRPDDGKAFFDRWQ